MLKSLTHQLIDKRESLPVDSLSNACELVHGNEDLLPHCGIVWISLSLHHNRIEILANRFEQVLETLMSLLNIGESSSRHDETFVHAAFDFWIKLNIAHMYQILEARQVEYERSFLIANVDDVEKQSNWLLDHIDFVRVLMHIERDFP